MNHRSIILLLSIVVILPVGTGVVSADDWPDSQGGTCSSEAEFIDSGSYSGAFDARYEGDTYKLSIPEDESIDVEFSADHGFPTVEYESENVLVDNTGENSYANNIEGGWRVHYNGDGATASWRVYAEEDAALCVEMVTTSDTEYPINWALELRGPLLTPTPTPTPNPTPTPSPTPTPTPAPTPTSTATATATPTPTSTPAAKAAPTDNLNDSTPSPADDNSPEDDIQDSDGDGVIDSEDYAPNDPEVQKKSDFQDTSEEDGPGFGLGITIVCFLTATFILRWVN